jgi:hypothetical protein
MIDLDTADELIAATSVVHGVPLLTRDRAIRRSKIVPLARAGGVAAIRRPPRSALRAPSAHFVTTTSR